MCVSRSSAQFSLVQLIRLLGQFFKALIGKASDVHDVVVKLECLSNLEDKVVQAITLVTVKHTNLDLMAMRCESNCDYLNE